MWVYKFAAKAPKFIVRALAGDPSAIAILAAMGIAVAGKAIYDEFKKPEK